MGLKMDFNQMPNSQFGVDQTKVKDIHEGLRAYMLRVYNYMAAGLGLTGVMALLTLNSSIINMMVGPEGLTLFGWIAVLAPLALLLISSFRMHKMSGASMQLFYWAYTGLSGLGLGLLFFVYLSAGLHDPTSIATIFFVTASAFLGLSIVGYTTKKDLTGMGSFLIMAVFGLLIASVVNIFLGSGMMAFLINCAVVLVFAGLTAYDTQQIKRGYFEQMSDDTATKSAIFGALMLYIDFMAMFRALLALFASGDD